MWHRPSRRSHNMARTASFREQWRDIRQTYDTAEQSGAIYQIRAKPESVKDSQLGLQFVIQIAESLRDKPKPPKTRSFQSKFPQQLHQDNDLDCLSPLATSCDSLIFWACSLSGTTCLKAKSTSFLDKLPKLHSLHVTNQLVQGC